MDFSPQRHDGIDHDCHNRACSHLCFVSDAQTGVGFRTLTNLGCSSCASSPGNLDVYARATRSVGRTIAESGALLVYGGGTRGLMGESASK